MKVAVLGFGELGQTVWEHLGFPPGNDADDLERGLVLVPQGTADAPFQVTELEDVLRDESIGAVADCLDDPALAYDCAVRVLESGKHFVTADRVLVEEHGIELNHLARDMRAAFLFGGAFSGDTVSVLSFVRKWITYGKNKTVILHSADNYILWSIQRYGKTFSEALKEVHLLGCTEEQIADAVSGTDALWNVKLSCAVGYKRYPTEGTLCEGIESFTEADARSLASLGLICILTGCCGRQRFFFKARGVRGDGVFTYAVVEPTLYYEKNLDTNSIESGIFGLDGEITGGSAISSEKQFSIIASTASSVVRDLLSITQGKRNALEWYCKRGAVNNPGLNQRYYVRCRFGASLRLKIEKRFDSKRGVSRVLTKPMKSTEMHAFAAKRRAKGEQIFFAVWDCE